LYDLGVQPVLQIACPNRVGLVNAITALVLKRQGDIAEIDQHIDAETQDFFMRMSWDDPGQLKSENFLQEVQSIIGTAPAQARLILNNTPKKMAILVSQHDHCLVDLLWRIKNHELNVVVPIIISNHPDHQKLAQLFEIPYHVLPVDKKSQPEQEQKIAQLLKSHNIDFVVLARYMRVLGSALINEYEQRIINIHHSFLPAFAGANPYRQAHEQAC
jgi:formyltetrahydrofolate deformylase